MTAIAQRTMILAAAAILATAVPSPAGEPTEGLKRTTDEVLAIVRHPDLQGPERAGERMARIRTLIDDRFAWQQMARRALSRHWRKRTDAERGEFAALFRELIEQTYIGEVEKFSGETLRYEGDTVDGNFAVVKVVLITRKNNEIKIRYRVLKRKAGPNVGATTRPTTRPAPKWLVYDFTVEGVSLVNNYRTQIRDIMARSSYRNLLKKLRDKIKKLRAAAPDAGKPERDSSSP